MSKVKIVLNREGVRELMQSKEMLDACVSLANGALGQLGDGYEVTTRVGKSRVNAEIAASTYKARKENMETNSILKALEGVRE